MLKTTPAVFAVGNDYQIMAPVTEQTLFWVRVAGEDYFDESNGIMRSAEPIHRVTVPQKALDEAGEYTVFERVLVERKPYFSLTEEPRATTFRFFPVRENFRVYQIADAHNREDDPIAAAKAFGDFDLLILNGDIPNHSGTVENFDTVYRLAAALTEGTKPVIFSRGNHDLRGICAEKFADYTPQQNGNTYYTLRVGPLWAILLDCGEDKTDDHEEYGYTVACHGFRRRESAFLDRVIADAEHEYAAPDVKYRLVISHVPFTHILPPPFDIEQDVYSYWAKRLKENVRPDAMLCGHLHQNSVWPVGCPSDHLGQPCTVIVGSRPTKTDFAGVGLIFENGTVTARFTCSDGTVGDPIRIK